MQTVCNKVACINERGNIAVAVVVVLLFSSVLSRPLLACNVTDVDLHVGSTPSIACDDDLTTAYVGNPFYTCVEWTADPPDDHPFEYFYEEDIGEEEWQSTTGVYEIPGTYRHAHIPLSLWESGQHTLRIKIRRKDVGDSWHPSNACTVNIGKVTGVSGPNAACPYEWPTFRVTTDPAGYYSGVVWKVDGVQRQVGNETFMYSWIYTGTKTVTACLGDSCASKEIEIITDLTVLPQEAYVGLGDSKIFEAWVCEGDSAVKKTSAQGVEWSATRGGFTGDTYTPSSASPSEGYDSVTAEYGEDEDSAVVTNFECDVTTPTSTAMDITTAPAMPSATFHADIEPEDILSKTTFKWYLNMTFTHDTLGELTHRVPTSGTDDVEGNENWTPNWGGLPSLAGGSVSVHVAASVADSSTEDGQDGYQIRGTNPTQSQIFGIADLRARAVCWKESTHRQFAAIRYTGIAMPLPCYRHDGGYGLMMLTPGSEAEAWNWITNLNSGISHLNTEYNRSVQHVSNINTPGIAPNPEPTPDPELTMTTDQHWMNAFSLYRAGTYYYGYELVSGTEYQWVRNSGTGPDYADDIVDIMNDPPW